RATTHRDQLAAPTLPRTLDAPEPPGPARPSARCQGDPGPDPQGVGGQSYVGLTTNHGGAWQARHRGGEVDGGKVPGAPVHAALANVADIPRYSCEGPRLDRFPHRGHGPLRD